MKEGVREKGAGNGNDFPWERKKKNELVALDIKREREEKNGKE